jgi:hypothetical protein
MPEILALLATGSLAILAPNVRAKPFVPARSSAASSGYRGVSSQGDRWRARICISKTEYTVGDFETEEAAAKAYDLEAIRKGKIKSLNFVYRGVNEALVGAAAPGGGGGGDGTPTGASSLVAFSATTTASSSSSTSDSPAPIGHLDTRPRSLVDARMASLGLSTAPPDLTDVALAAQAKAVFALPPLAAAARGASKAPVPGGFFGRSETPQQVGTPSTAPPHRSSSRAQASRDAVAAMPGGGGWGAAAAAAGRNTSLYAAAERTDSGTPTEEDAVETEEGWGAAGGGADRGWGMRGPTRRGGTRHWTQRERLESFGGGSMTSLSAASVGAPGTLQSQSGTPDGSVIAAVAAAAAAAAAAAVHFAAPAPTTHHPVAVRRPRGRPRGSKTRVGDREAAAAIAASRSSRRRRSDGWASEDDGVVWDGREEDEEEEVEVDKEGGWAAASFSHHRRASSASTSGSTADAAMHAHAEALEAAGLLLGTRQARDNHHGVGGSAGEEEWAGAVAIFPADEDGPWEASGSQASTGETAVAAAVGAPSSFPTMSVAALGGFTAAACDDESAAPRRSPVEAEAAAAALAMVASSASSSVGVHSWSAGPPHCALCGGVSASAAPGTPLEPCSLCDRRFHPVCMRPEDVDALAIARAGSALGSPWACPVCLGKAWSQGEGAAGPGPSSEAAAAMSSGVGVFRASAHLHRAAAPAGEGREAGMHARDAPCPAAPQPLMQRHVEGERVPAPAPALAAGRHACVLRFFAREDVSCLLTDAQRLKVETLVAVGGEGPLAQLEVAQAEFGDGDGDGDGVGREGAPALLLDALARAYQGWWDAGVRLGVFVPSGPELNPRPVLALPAGAARPEGGAEGEGDVRLSSSSAAAAKSPFSTPSASDGSGDCEILSHSRSTAVEDDVFPVGGRGGGGEEEEEAGSLAVLASPPGQGLLGAGGKRAREEEGGEGGQEGKRARECL